MTPRRACCPRAAQHLVGSPKRESGSRTPPRNEGSEAERVASKAEKVESIAVKGKSDKGDHEKGISFTVDGTLMGLINYMLDGIVPYEQDKEIVQ